MSRANGSKYPKTSKLLRAYLRSALLLAVALAFVAQSSAGALTPAQRRSYANKGIYFIDDPCSVTGSAATDLKAGVSDTANAKVVIGIAKTYNLGKEGALIGLMTAVTESHLQIYANSGIPISMQNPTAQAIGNDHDSLGIMQQRVSTNWSTFGNTPSKDVVYQLMDPAYSAQAFFGTPPGAKLPSNLKDPGALKKGLQNIPNWQSLDPGVAAQTVQISAFPDRYNQHKLEAQNSLNNLWDSSPPIPLPIPITGGTAAEPSAGGCPLTTFGSIYNTIVSYAYPHYIPPVMTTPKPEYAAAIKAAQARGEYVGGCDSAGCYPGIDCGGFVTRVMRDSGVDPNYNDANGPTQAQKAYLDRHPEKYKHILGVTGTNNLPTDQGQVYIAIIASEHTYFYVGKFNYTLGGQSMTWETPAASSSIGPPWRAPMADGVDTPSNYDWYQVIQ